MLFFSALTYNLRTHTNNIYILTALGSIGQKPFDPNIIKKNTTYIKYRGCMKKILLITTGGTIASKPTVNGLTPEITSEEILQYIPEADEICSISTYGLFNLDSTNICYRHWIAMVECIKDNYGAYDGFVITHGTDTMAYTAAALSYMVQDSPKPIVITGSQKPLAVADSDARSNLLNAIVFACDERAHGVHLLFDNKVILGTRARKTHTKSFNAFKSIDFPEIAIVRDRRVRYYIEEKVAEGGPVFYTDLNPNVFVLRLVPGMNPEIFRFLKEHYDGLVIESFGVGGIPCYGNEDFVDAIADWIACGKALVMTTQVPHEGSDMSVYMVGQVIKKKYRLIEAYDMTTEAIVTKLMWILGQTSDEEQVRRLFYKPVQNDLNI